MNESQFHKRIKQILSNIRRGEHDSSPEAIHEAFHNNVIGKSGGVWDEVIAEQEIQQIEWAFNVQPEEVRVAASVKESDVISTLVKFLQERGYGYTPIQVAKVKTPEGYIETTNRKYICEVKSPELKFDYSAAPFGYKFATAHRKILNFIHTATKQFKSQDADHELPHILIYTSAHSQLNWKSFIDAIHGGVINQKGERSPDFSDTPVYKSTFPLLFNIDLYIWLQVNGSGHKFIQASYIINEESKHFKECMELVNSLSQIKVSSMGMDNIISIKPV